jgi:hypothetical protein
MTGVLPPLRDNRFLVQGFIDHSAVALPEEIDLTPHAISEEVESVEIGGLV